MNRTDIITTGPFTAGEIPLAIPVSFLETPEDLTGWDLAVTAEIDGADAPTFAATVTWSDPTVALALLRLPQLTAAGAVSWHRVQVWAGNGMQRIASLPIKFPVVPAVGTHPNI